MCSLGTALACVYETPFSLISLTNASPQINLTRAGTSNTKRTKAGKSLVANPNLCDTVILCRRRSTSRYTAREIASMRYDVDSLGKDDW